MSSPRGHNGEGAYISGETTNTRPDRTGSWVLERYQLRKELHVGAGGELWLARERDTRELVVARIATRPGAVARVRQEASALSRLGHRGVPRLVDQGPVEDGFCLIAEHVEGAPLSKVLRVAIPAPSRAVGWARQIAETIAHLHAAGVVHGDLHPGNVIATRDEVGRDRMVLIGFGGAILDGALAEDGSGSLDSPYTAAPELIERRTIHAGTDIYAIGAILYRMLADRWPFAGPAADVLAAQVASPPPPLGRHAPTLRLPPGLELLVFRCLAKVPEERFGSAEELALALASVEYLPHRDWVRAEGSVAPAPSRPERRAPEPPQWPMVALALIAAIVLLSLWLAL